MIVTFYEITINCESQLKLPWCFQVFLPTVTWNHRSPITSTPGKLFIHLRHLSCDKGFYICNCLLDYDPLNILTILVISIRYNILQSFLKYYWTITELLRVHKLVGQVKSKAFWSFSSSYFSIFLIEPTMSRKIRNSIRLEFR